MTHWSVPTQASNTGLEAPAPGDLVFDDEPLEEVLYAPSHAAPSPASIFLEARACVHRILERGRAQDADGILDLTRRLVIEQPVARETCAQLHAVLELLPRLCLSPDGSYDPDVLLSRLCEIGRHHDATLLTSAGIIAAFRLLEQRREMEAAGLWKELRSLQASLPKDGQDHVERAVNRHADLAAHHFWQSRKPGSDAAWDAIEPLVSLPDHPTSIPLAVAVEDRPLLKCLLELTPILAAFAAKFHAGFPPQVADAFRNRLRTVAVMALAAGDDHPFTVTCLNMLIRDLQDSGEHAAAVRLSHLAVAFRVRELGATHPLVSASLNNLGLSLVNLGQLDEAEFVLQRAIAIALASPYPWYWLARLHQLRAADVEAELLAWKNYVLRARADDEYRSFAIGRQRIEEAARRIAELVSCEDSLP